MTITVIVRLKIINIDHCQYQWSAFTDRLLYFGLQDFIKEAAIVYPRQRIDVRQLTVHFKLNGATPQLSMFHRPIHGNLDLIHAERFYEIIQGARSHTLDGIFNRAIAGDNYDIGAGVFRFELLYQ